MRAVNTQLSFTFIHSVVIDTPTSLARYQLADVCKKFQKPKVPAFSTFISILALIFYDRHKSFSIIYENFLSYASKDVPVYPGQNA